MSPEEQEALRDKLPKRRPIQYSAPPSRSADPFGVPRPGPAVPPIPTPLDITSGAPPRPELDAETVLSNSELSRYGYRKFPDNPAATTQGARSSEKTVMSEDSAVSHKPQAISERSFNVALAAYGAMFGTGLLQSAAHDWYFGPIFTLGGGLGLMSIHPLIRPKLQIMRSNRSLWAVITVTWIFLAANVGFAIYDHLWPKAATPISASSPERWPSFTPTQADALASRIRFIPPEDIVVACETLNCRDLADGIAEILQKTPGWHVSILHRGGLDITGVTGIQLNPNEPATEALRDAIESTAGLAVRLGPDTRKDLGNDTRTFLVVGTRPF